VLAKGKTPAQLAGFAHGLDLLGLVPDWADLPRLAGGEGGAQVDDAIAQRIDALLDTRAKARASKDWDMADRVRDILTAAGWKMRCAGSCKTWRYGSFDGAMEAVICHLARAVLPGPWSVPGRGGSGSATAIVIPGSTRDPFRQLCGN